jgi:predicted MFS family arabinose efflux permease
MGCQSSAYAVWGWRIPFLIGALLAGALFLYYYLAVPESEVWRSSKKSAAPLKEVFAGADVRRLGQLIVVMSGAWLTLDATVAAVPGVINTVLGVESPDVNTGILIGAAISVPIFPLIGVLSQRFGRRPSLATILPGFYSFYMLGLAKFMPYVFSPIVLLAAGGLMLTLGALAGPETKHVDFNP